MGENQKSEAYAFLEEHEVGVLGTTTPDGMPHVRTMYYTTDESFAVYFFTLTGTRKTEEVEQDTRAAFVVSSEDPPRTLQLEGTIRNLTDTATVDDVAVKKLTDTIFRKGLHSAPLTHLDSGKIVFYKLTPRRIRWGDFTRGLGTDNSLFEIMP